MARGGKQEAIETQGERKEEKEEETEREGGGDKKMEKMNGRKNSVGG